MRFNASFFVWIRFTDYPFPFIKRTKRRKYFPEDSLVTFLFQILEMGPKKRRAANNKENLNEEKQIDVELESFSIEPIIVRFSRPNDRTLDLILLVSERKSRKIRRRISSTGWNLSKTNRRKISTGSRRIRSLLRDSSSSTEVVATSRRWNRSEPRKATSQRTKSWPDEQNGRPDECGKSKDSIYRKT